MRILFIISLLCPVACEKPLQVTATPVSKGEVEATVSSITSGTVKAEQVTELAFGTVGRVAKLNVELGDKVSAGQVLAELENEDWKTSLEVANSELARQQELWKSKVSAKLELDRARERRDSMATALEKSIIRALFNGIITELNLEIGQLSQITAVIPKPLIRLVDENPRFVRAEIDEVDLAKMKPGLPARIKVLAVRKEPFPAKLRKIIPAINSVREQDRTVTVELALETPELLPDGASADVEIILEQVKDTLVVPTRSVLGRSGQYSVYLLENNLAKKRDVKIGIRGFEFTQILSGLSLGELVIEPTDMSELQDGKSVALKK